MSLMNSECGHECACRCHQVSTTYNKKPKNNKIVRDLGYRSGDKSLDYKIVEFYIEKWLKPHRDGIAKRKGLTH